MENRLQVKWAGMVFLAVLFVISLTEVILNATLFQDVEFSTYLVRSSFSASLATLILAPTLLLIAYLGRDRLLYIVCGGWMAFFVFEQALGLPGEVMSFINLMGNLELTGVNLALKIVSMFIQIATMVCIFVIGCLLVEYLEDGTIYNTSFNILCFFAIMLQLISLFIAITELLSGGSNEFILVMTYNLSRISMIFLLAFYAHNIAKEQLAKVQL